MYAQMLPHEDFPLWIVRLQGGLTVKVVLCSSVFSHNLFRKLEAGVASTLQGRHMFLFGRLGLYRSGCLAAAVRALQRCIMDNSH